MEIYKIIKISKLDIEIIQFSSNSLIGEVNFDLLLSSHLFINSKTETFSKLLLIN